MTRSQVRPLLPNETITQSARASLRDLLAAAQPALGPDPPVLRQEEQGLEDDEPGELLAHAVERRDEQGLHRVE